MAVIEKEHPMIRVLLFYILYTYPTVITCNTLSNPPADHPHAEIIGVLCARISDD